MPNRQEGEKPDIFTHFYTQVPVSRRRLGEIAGLVAGGRLLTGARPAFAGGGGEPPKEPRSRDIADEEKQRIIAQSGEHVQRTQSTMEKFFSKYLRDRYGYQVHPVDTAKLLGNQSLTSSPSDPYTISSEVQLSSVQALNIYSSSFYDRTDFRGSRLDIYIPEYGDLPYYIPELNDLVTSFTRGSSKFLDVDMEKAVHTAFDLPANTRDLGLLNKDSRDWEGTADDGRLVRAHVNMYRRLGIFVAP